VLNCNLVSTASCRVFQNLDVKQESQSDTIDSSIPCNRTISYKYNSVNFSSVYFTFIGIK
jgi:hypothetical protein